jgi:hypothetical protein
MATMVAGKRCFSVQKLSQFAFELQLGGCLARSVSVSMSRDVGGNFLAQLEISNSVCF